MELHQPAGSSPEDALPDHGRADETIGLIFEFTRDPDLLRQYHAIYEREFRAVHNAPYQHIEDEHDRRAHILVVRRGDICVGGARLSVKTPTRPDPLPIEMDGFRIEDHFPHLGQREMSYGQLGRVCLLPELRDGIATRLMFWHIHRKAAALGLAELFGTATLVGTRTYKRHCRALGLDASIYRDIELPTYPMCEELKFYLIKSALDTPPLESPAGFSGDLAGGSMSAPSSASGHPASTLALLKECFAQVSAEFAASPAIRRLASGSFTIAHYKEYLRQVYYYTRESSQLLALAAVYFRGSDRDTVKNFLKHAGEEIGHDRWALNDLASLGEDVSRIPYENPLPATLAFTAFTFHQIVYRNPIAHLGYVYFLEFLPTSSGDLYIGLLERLGVPKSAMSFLLEHIKVDTGHNRLMERYAHRLIHTEADMAAVRYSMRVTGKLYADMLQAAIEQVDNPKDWGTSYDELERQRTGEGMASR